MALVGPGDLAALKLDADLAFPARIKDALTNWRVGSTVTIGGRDAQIVQGTTADRVRHLVKVPVLLLRAKTE